MRARRRLRVLIACECSGAIREEFRRLGHDAWSCDKKPAEDGSLFHIQGDCFEAAFAGCPTDGKPWDLIIWHPPCTDIAVSSNAHAAAKKADGRQKAGIEFFLRCANFPVDMSVVENPISIMSTHYREPDQIIQPHEFGEDASKATCLWLRGVKPLLITHGDGDFFLTPTPDARRPRYVCCGISFGYERGKYGCANCNGQKTAKLRWSNQTDSGQNRLAPGPTRATDRARTYPGIAQAMAEQWGGLVK